jgi:hypothetical protein
MGAGMHRISLLSLALLVGMPAAAGAETVQQALQRFNLLGTWAADCIAPPSAANPYTRYLPLQNGNVRRLYVNSPTTTSGDAELESVSVTSPEILSYRQKTPQGYLNVVLKKTGMQIRILSSRNENGEIYVEDGKFTAKAGNGQMTGRESPTQNKCLD